MRVAKAISNAGICSRRDAEKLILEGKVTVNGETIPSPALNITESDVVAVNGETLKPKGALRVWIYHKPAGLITTHRDTRGRPTIFDHLPKHLPRVISVGRLDLQSEGLMILTNSGDFARKLELPSSAVERIYKVRCYGAIDIKALKEAEKGIMVEGETFYPKKIELLEESINSWLQITLTEGKNREIRKILGHFDLKISKLIRISYGPYSIANLKRGEIREVSGSDINLD